MDRVVIDGGELTLNARMDGAESTLTRNIDGGETGENFQPLPLISIGEVTTLPSGSEATATMSGTASQPLLNLGLVQGVKGLKGDKGDTGTLNSVTATVDSNVGTPSVEVVYDGENAEFNFHNLKGADGAGAVESVNGQTGTVVLDAEDVGALPDNTVIPSKTSDLMNDSGFITTETDPTVPSWAKASSKPSYTASEVGALPDDTTIPSKTSDLTNDSGFLTLSTLPIWNGSVSG